ncbi:MAG: cytochrome c3 family protein [Gemmatimonadales bacterium]
MSARLAAALVAAATLVTAGAAARRPATEAFPHEKHAKLFPLCTTCHAGVVDQGAPVWPAAESCVECHDGRIESRVEWAPRRGPRVTNLAFDHFAHARTALIRTPGDSAKLALCGSCHNQTGAPRMTVQHAISGQCIDCHELGETHLAVADSACSTCHLSLAEARTLPRERIAAFPKPPSHERADFGLEGHGKLAEPGQGRGGAGVAASCATCHARDFCITCHVNAPEVGPIEALALDPRSLAIEAKLPTPTGHAKASFQRDHGRDASRSSASCATCHTQPNCTACHVESRPSGIGRLAMPGPGRATGPSIHRTKPTSHTASFAETHGPEANSRPSSCEACHVRSDCLDCHRPAPDGGGGFHPAGFLTRHPTSAYTRDATCSDCHNPAQFCQSCHQQAGFRVDGRLGGQGFHDGRQAFLIGHGQAARQNLESCASCHAERDCTACHSAVGGGFRFSPHGPGFDPDRLRRKNPSLCVACHGTAIPGVR